MSSGPKKFKQSQLSFNLLYKTVENNKTMECSNIIELHADIENTVSEANIQKSSNDGNIPSESVKVYQEEVPQEDPSTKDDKETHSCTQIDIMILSTLINSTF